MYRGRNGRKCAAGCLISDEEYLPTMEHMAWEELVDEGLPAHHEDLIQELQKIHDNESIELWELKLEELRKTYFETIE